jgi:hypothetical protein
VINRRFDWNYLLRLAIGESRNPETGNEGLNWSEWIGWDRRRDLTLRLKRWCEWVRMWMNERTRCLVRVLDLASWFGNWNEIWTLNNLNIRHLEHALRVDFYKCQLLSLST